MIAPRRSIGARRFFTGLIQSHRSLFASRRFYGESTTSGNRRQRRADQGAGGIHCRIFLQEDPARGRFSHQVLSPRLTRLRAVRLDAALGKIITSFTKELGKGKGALIWGDGSEVPSTSAPLANGTLIHSFEMDDLHRVGVIHPGSEAIPATDTLVRHVGNVGGNDFLPPLRWAMKSVAGSA